MLELIKQGGFVMYPLILLSVLSLGVIFERIFFWFKVSKSRDFALVNKILKFVEEGEPDTAAQFGLGTNDFVARTLLNGLRHRFYSLKLALETQALIEVKKMRKNLIVLDTIITAAPLLGILGTVVGIIISFDLLGGEVADPKAVTSGIAQALITTAYGLSVALLTIFPFNYFTSKCNDSIEELERYSSTLELLIDRYKYPSSSNEVSEQRKGFYQS